LSEELKGRISRIAERSGTTGHAFILEAVSRHLDNEESRSDFHHTAEQRYAKIIASGETIPWEEMQVHLKARLSKKQAPPPPARRLSD
jgi:predicted transcriptional regulator